MKKSTLFLLKAKVTFTPSSLKASSPGDGKKSGTILILPIGSSVYFIFALINGLTLAPIAGAENADDIVSVCKSDSKDATVNYAKTVEALFAMTVLNIFCNYALWIGKSVLRLPEGYFVLFLVGFVLVFVPFKLTSCHERQLTP